MDPDPDDEVAIKDEKGNTCGYFRWKLITSEKGMWPKDFPFHRQQVPLAEVFPIAFLDWIEIWKDQQGRKLGTKGLREFIELASVRGARIGYFRIGWNSEEDRLRKLKWYKRHGWMELSNSDPQCTVPFMYHRLGGG
jgi:hypothetical protein